MIVEGNMTVDTPQLPISLCAPGDVVLVNDAVVCLVGNLTGGGYAVPPAQPDHVPAVMLTDGSVIYAPPSLMVVRLGLVAKMP